MSRRSLAPALGLLILCAAGICRADVPQESAFKIIDMGPGVGTIEDISTLPVNGGDVIVVGQLQVSFSESHAYMFYAGHMTDLNGLLAPDPSTGRKFNSYAFSAQQGVIGRRDFDSGRSASFQYYNGQMADWSRSKVLKDALITSINYEGDYAVVGTIPVDAGNPGGDKLMNGAFYDTTQSIKPARSKPLPQLHRGDQVSANFMLNDALDNHLYFCGFDTHEGAPQAVWGDARTGMIHPLDYLSKRTNASAYHMNAQFQTAGEAYANGDDGTGFPFPCVWNQEGRVLDLASLPKPPAIQGRPTGYAVRITDTGVACGLEKSSGPVLWSVGIPNQRKPADMRTILFRQIVPQELSGKGKVVMESGGRIYGGPSEVPIRINNAGCIAFLMDFTSDGKTHGVLLMPRVVARVPPKPPAAISMGVVNEEFVLSWKNQDESTLWFEVEKRSPGKDFVYLAAAPADRASLTLGGGRDTAEAGDSYRVRAANMQGYSGYVQLSFK